MPKGRAGLNSKVRVALLTNFLPIYRLLERLAERRTGPSYLPICQDGGESGLAGLLRTAIWLVCHNRPGWACARYPSDREITAWDRVVDAGAK